MEKLSEEEGEKEQRTHLMPKKQEQEIFGHRYRGSVQGDSAQTIIVVRWGQPTPGRQAKEKSTRM